MKILLVDDEQTALTTIRRLLKRKGFTNVEICDNGTDAIEKIKNENFDIVLLDLLMPDVNGIKVLEATKPFKPNTEFIILTAVDDVPTAVNAIRLGAYDCLVKSGDSERLLLSIERAYERKELLTGLSAPPIGIETRIPEAFSGIITRCPSMWKIFSYAQIIAKSSNPVLITGESGTGKELIARGIHKAGLSPNGPFVAVNVSSIPETLFESQLFGYVKGAYTGADKNYPGIFEQASGGTLFLDEIGELPLNLQVKLLRVLEEQTVVRLGETRSIPVSVRIISSTNMNLNKACREGRFRLDLLHRIKSAYIYLPPLRERRSDIPLLVSYFLERACARQEKGKLTFSPEALDILTNKEYPGNIRELEQLIENAALLADSTLILPHHLGKDEYPPSVSCLERRLCSLKESNETHIAYVLTHTKGNRKEAARILGITTRHLQRKLAQMKKKPLWESVLCDI